MKKREKLPTVIALSVLKLENYGFFFIVTKIIEFPGIYESTIRERESEMFSNHKSLAIKSDFYDELTQKLFSMQRIDIIWGAVFHNRKNDDIEL